MSWGYQLIFKIKEWVVNDKVKETVTDSKQTKVKKPYIPPKQNIHFKNNIAAFHFASQQYSANMNPQKMSFGIVQDLFKFEDGSVQFIVQLANTDQTTLVSGLNDKHADKISKGNLIYWGYFEHVDKPNILNIDAIGHILATLYPEYDPNNGKWVIKNDLTK